MPYIKPENRENFNKVLEEVTNTFEKNGVTPGDLNYLLSKIGHLYIKRKTFGYTHINDVVGVLECAKQEFYRKIATPYEETKIIENGDI